MTGTAVQGWKLVRECIEPNPGPSMANIIESLRVKLGEDAPAFEPMLKELTDAIKSNNPGRLSFSDVEVEAFLQHHSGHVNSIFKAEAVNITKFLNEILLATPTVLTQALPADTIFSGLPPLNVQRISSSAASIPIDHEEAQLIACEFALIDNLPTSTLRPSLIRNVTSSPTINWASESDIQGYAKLVLLDILNALGLDTTLSCYNELSVFRWRGDIWVIVDRFGVSVGVIEVKKPDASILDNLHTHGQILDYMNRLKYFFGQTISFGIATTYEGWRLYTSSKEAAEAISVNKSNLPSMPLPKLNKSIYSWKGSLDVSAQPEPKFAKTSLRRKVFASKIYKFDDPVLVPMLMTMILKMLYAPREDIPILHPKRRYIVLTETSLYWDALSGVNSLDFSRMPSRGATQLFLLEDMRAGADGRAWLVCSITGRVGVLKFMLKEKPSSKLELNQEAELWNKVWNIPARVGTFGEELGLLMPYVFPCTDKEQQERDVRAAVIIAVTRLAKSGVHHLDVKWRHVGLYRDHKNVLRALLFDFSRVSQHIPKSQHNEIMMAMLDKLGITKQEYDENKNK